jgi:hypothetical protein
MMANRTVSILRCKWVILKSACQSVLLSNPIWGPTVRQVANSVGRLNCCWILQHSHSCLQSPRDTWTRFLFYPRHGASSSTRELSVFLCRRYVCCTAVSARVYPRCHGVQVTVGSVLTLSPVNAGLCCRLCLHLRNYCAERSQPDHRHLFTRRMACSDWQYDMGAWSIIF